MKNVQMSVLNEFVAGLVQTIAMERGTLLYRFQEQLFKQTGCSILLEEFDENMIIFHIIYNRCGY